MNLLFRYINIAILCGSIVHLPTDLAAAAPKVHPRAHNKTAALAAAATQDTYDYIVIGSCAGAVVAKRLSDDKKTAVLLLEMGDGNNTDPLFVDSSEALTAAGELFPEASYQGVSVAQPNIGGAAFDFGNARIFGGGSSHNGLQVVLGSADYWQKIANIVGPDWSVNKVFARYKALENFQNDGPGGIGASRGTSGLWHNVLAPANVTPDVDFLVGAFATVSGLPVINDYNDRTASPVGPFKRWDYQEQFDKGYTRESAAFAFLGSNVIDSNGNGKGQRKLQVKTRAPAISLLWDSTNPTKVIGVRYMKAGQVIDAIARKEVIVAAGLLSAPFLQLNGIGPSDVLMNAGVTPRVINENVGRHMHNHVGVFTIFNAPQEQLITSAEPWGLWSGGAFFPGESSNERTSGFIVVDGNLMGAPNSVALVALIAKVESEGTIFIQDDDFTKIPLFNPNYLSDPRDMQELKHLLRTQLIGLDDYFATHPSPENTTWSLAVPSRAVVEDDAALEDFIRSNLISAYHYTGQTRMGPNSLTSVVDSHGRVYGVANLRVADVSILPLVPDGNTCTPAILCGWTISEFILAGQ